MHFGQDSAGVLLLYKASLRFPIGFGLVWVGLGFIGFKALHRTNGFTLASGVWGKVESADQCSITFRKAIAMAMGILVFKQLCSVDLVTRECFHNLY